MKPGKGGSATGPPRLGAAIIGATLLLKGDVLTLRDEPQRGNKPPETLRGQTAAGALPVIGFGDPQSADGSAKPRRHQPPAAARARRKAAPPPRAEQFATREPVPKPSAFDGVAPAETRVAETPEAEPAQARVSVPESEAANGDAKPGNPAPAEPSAATAPQLPEPAFGGPPPAVVSGPDALEASVPQSPAELGAAQLAAPPLFGPEAQSAPAAQPLPELAVAVPGTVPFVAAPAAGIEAQTEAAPVMAVEPAHGPAETSAARVAMAVTPAPRLAHAAPAAPAGTPLAQVPVADPEPVLTTSTPLPVPAFGAAIPAPPADAAILAVAPALDNADPLPAPAFGPRVRSLDPAKPVALAAAGALPSAGAASKSMTGPSGAAPASPAAGYTDTSPRVDAGRAPEFSTDDELILQLQTTRGEMSDTMIAYGTRSGVFLPLGALARFLDLAIVVSDGGHYASGWFIDESQTLAINLRQGTVNAGGTERGLARGEAAAFEGELYLRAEHIAQLLPLALDVDLRAQTITVRTRVPFPFEQRLARDAERARLEGRGARATKRWPREETPWRLLSFPMLDAELRGVSDQTYGTRAEGDLRIAGDLAMMTARAFVEASSDEGLIGARIELGRRDPDSRLLGPLRASEFQFGDVTTLALPLGLRGTSGRGAFITNAPLERASVFDTIDLDGDLPGGYEVELYRNNILIGSSRTPLNGQYRFLNVAVDYGLNVFRLVFYGPQGQRREEVRRVSVGDGRLSPGEFIYTLGAAQKEVNVFDVRRRGFTPGLDYGAWRTTALLEYGLTRQLTMALGGAWFESRFGRQWQAIGGVRTGIADTAVKLDLGYQSGGGKAAELGVGGKISGLGYTLTHGEYRGGFIDEQRSFSGDLLRRSSELNVNAALKLGGGERALVVPLIGQLRRAEFANGRKETEASLRASLPFSQFLLSNNVGYVSTSSPGFGTTTQLRGSFDLATLSGSRVHFRAGVDYGILPRLRLEGATFEADYALDPRTLVRASLSHTLTDSQTSFGLSAIRRFGYFSLALDAGYGFPARNYNAALRLGFSLGRNPLSGRLIVTEPGLATGGAVAARAFRDSNANRAFDAGETVLPDVGFAAGSSNARTDAQGIAFLGKLSDGSRATVTLDRDTLPDIALAAVSEGVEVVPRAGRVHVTNYAVQELSDIEGTAYFAQDGTLGREVSGLQLLLVDGQGKALARARTEGDGSFFFEQVAPGTYAIAIDPNQAASLKIHLADAINVTIGPKSAWLKQVVKVSAD